MHQSSREWCLVLRGVVTENKSKSIAIQGAVIDLTATTTEGPLICVIEHYKSLGFQKFSLLPQKFAAVHAKQPLSGDVNVASLGFFASDKDFCKEGILFTIAEILEGYARVFYSYLHKGFVISRVRYMFDLLKRVKKGDLIRVLDYPPGIIFDKKFSDDMINRWAEKESRVGRPSPEETELKRKAISQSDISLPSKRQKVVAVERGIRDIVDRTEVVEKAHYPTTSDDTDDGLGEPLNTREDLEEANESGRSNGTPSVSHNISDAEDSSSNEFGDASLDDSGSERFPSPSRDALVRSKAPAIATVSRCVSFKDSEILPISVISPTFRVIQPTRRSKLLPKDVAVSIQKPFQRKEVKDHDERQIQKQVKEKTVKEGIVQDYKQI
ncbi:unnamed protein product [Calypogeia fissa]